MTTDSIQQISVNSGNKKVPTQIEEGDGIVWFHDRACIGFAKRIGSGRAIYFDGRDDKRQVRSIQSEVDFLDFAQLIASILGFQLKHIELTGRYMAFKFVK